MVSAKNKIHKLCDHIFSEIFSRKVFKTHNTMVKTPEHARKRHKKRKSFNQPYYHLILAKHLKLNETHLPKY
jgi:hypothetical protein